MAKITDPDLLSQGVEILFNTGSSPKTIQLFVTGNLVSPDGVTLQAIYSFCKEEWRTDNNLVKFPFPIVSITEKKFDIVNDWNWHDATTKNLIRDAGWARKDLSNTSLEEYMGFITLGNIDFGGQVYFQQTGSSVDSGSNTVFTGSVNEKVQIYESGSYDRRNYFKCFIREQGKTFDASQLSAIGETTVTYQVYSFPLQNTSDTKITYGDDIITGSQPYMSMSIEYFTSSQIRSIGGSDYHFDKIINANGGSKTQVYEWAQYQLRRPVDIDSGSGTVIGKTADALLAFVGDTLLTRQGVYIDNFLTTDINAITFYDTGNIARNFPYVAAGTITFNDNLSNDMSAIYKMYFTSVPSGGFGSASAVIVNDNGGNPITGSILGSGSVSFTFDYDGNTQGGRTSASSAPITIVAIGLNTAQYVSTTGTITRTNANAYSLVSSLERNYSNT